MRLAQATGLVVMAGLVSCMPAGQQRTARVLAPEDGRVEFTTGWSMGEGEEIPFAHVGYHHGLVDGLQLDLAVGSYFGAGVTWGLVEPPDGGTALSMGVEARRHWLVTELGQTGESSDDLGAEFGVGWGGVLRLAIGARSGSFEWAVEPQVHGSRITDTFLDQPVWVVGVGMSTVGTLWFGSIGVSVGFAGLHFFQSVGAAEKVTILQPVLGLAW